MYKIIMLLAAAVLLAGPRTAPAQVPAELISYPQTILHNGKILTVDDAFTVAEALAIRDGLILATGTSQNMLRLRGPQTSVVDLQGKTVIPGFIATDGDGAPVAEALYKETSIGDRLLGTQQDLKTKAAILEFVRMVRGVLGRQCGLAMEHEVAQVFDDCDRGAVPAVGQAYGVQMLVDDHLREHDLLYLEGGKGGALLRVSRDEFNRLMGGATRGPFASSGDRRS
jgi:hypothetical protein